ncbi:hypothetical protein BD410DRAFT_883725, partial [Rickenella mellea]
IRVHIIKWRYDLQLPIHEIAKLAGCHERTVYKFLQLHRAYGQVTNPYALPRGRPRALNIMHLNYLRSLLLANPSLYLDELHSQLLLNCDTDVSLATLS